MPPDTKNKLISIRPLNQDISTPTQNKFDSDPYPEIKSIPIPYTEIKSIPILTL